jgi:hypothetical protein
VPGQARAEPCPGFDLDRLPHVEIRVALSERHHPGDKLAQVPVLQPDRYSFRRAQAPELGPAVATKRSQSFME